LSERRVASSVEKKKGTESWKKSHGIQNRKTEVERKIFVEKCPGGPGDEEDRVSRKGGKRKRSTDRSLHKFRTKGKEPAVREEKKEADLRKREKKQPPPY